MAQFKKTEVDTDELKEKAFHIEKEIETIEKALATIKEAIELLGQTWKGEASQLFMAIYSGDELYREKLLIAYKSLNERLQDATRIYKQGEDQALGIVNRLK